MPNNNTKIKAFLMQPDGHCGPYVSIQRDSGCTGMVYPLVRLRDYESLQADRDQQYEMKVVARAQRDSVTDQLKALQDECEKLRKDAERYRWLRSQCGTMGNLTIAKATSWELEGWSGDDPDSAIDKAMTEEKTNGN